MRWLRELYTKALLDAFKDVRNIDGPIRFSESWVLDKRGRRAIGPEIGLSGAALIAWVRRRALANVESMLKDREGSTNQASLPGLPAPPPDDFVLDASALDLLENLALPVRYRRVLAIIASAPLGTRQGTIEREFDLSPQAAKKLMQRARNRLRAIVKH